MKEIIRMEKNRQQLLDEVKDILRDEYDINTLKEVIAASSVYAVRELIKSNPNIDLKTLKSSLGKAGHGGANKLVQADIDNTKKQLGIPVQMPVAQPKPAVSNNSPKKAPATTPQAQSTTGAAAPIQAPPGAQQEKDKNIEKKDIEQVNQAENFLKGMSPEKIQEMNNSIKNIGIPGAIDYETAKKLINDYQNILMFMGNYRTIAGALAAIADQNDYPSKVAQAAAPQASAQPTNQAQAPGAAPKTA